MAFLDGLKGPGEGAGERIRERLEEERKREALDPEERKEIQEIERELIPEGERGPPPAPAETVVQRAAQEEALRQAGSRDALPVSDTTAWVDSLRADAFVDGTRMGLPLGEGPAAEDLEAPEAPLLQRRAELDAGKASVKSVEARARELREVMEPMPTAFLRLVKGFLKVPEARRAMEQHAPRLEALLDVQEHAALGLGTLGLKTPSLGLAALSGISKILDTPAFRAELARAPALPADRAAWATRLVVRLARAARSPESTVALQQAVTAYQKLVMTAGQAKPRSLIHQRDAEHLLDELYTLATFVEDPASSKLVIDAALLINDQYRSLRADDTGEMLTEPADWEALLIRERPALSRPLTQVDFLGHPLTQQQLQLIQFLGEGMNQREMAQKLGVSRDEVRKKEAALTALFGLPSSHRERLVDFIRSRDLGAFAPKAGIPQSRQSDPEEPLPEEAAPPKDAAPAPPMPREPPREANEPVPEQAAAAPGERPAVAEASVVPQELPPGAYEPPNLTEADFPGHHFNAMELGVLNAVAEGLSDQDTALRANTSRANMFQVRARLFKALGAKDVVALAGILPRTKAPRAIPTTLSPLEAALVQGVIDGLPPAKNAAAQGVKPTQAGRALNDLCKRLVIPNDPLVIALYGLHQLGLRPTPRP